MANRSVSVELQLKAAGFVAGAKESEKAVSSLNDELDEIGKHDKEFDEAQAGADELAVAMKETSREVDNTGEQMKGTGADARFLAAELAKTKREALELAAAFAATGDPENLAKFKKAKSYLSELERLGKDLDGAGAGGVAGGATAATAATAKSGSKLGRAMGLSAGQSFSEAFAGALGNPATWVAIAAVAIPAGAMVGGAVLAGISLAGIGAGIAGQIHDPRVMAAAELLGQDVSTGFAKSTSAFAAPLAGALGALDREWQKLQPGVTATMNELAPLVDDLADGAAGFIDALVPGLEEAAIAAKPLVQDIAVWLPQFGGEVADLFGTMADHADELEHGLQLVLGTLSLIVKVLDMGASAGSWLFKIMEWTNPGIGALEKLGAAGYDTQHQLLHLGESAETAGGSAADAATDFAALEKQLNTTSVSAEALITNKMLDGLMAADHMTLSLAESQTRLSESFKENGRSIDIHTAKGQANREAVLAAVEQNIRWYQSMMAAGASAEDAARAYDDNTAALEAQLRKAHLTQKEIDGLIGKYRGVPGEIKTEIEMEGLTAAISDLNDLLREINHLPPRKQVVVDVIHVSRGQATAFAAGGHWSGRAAASGMFLPASDPGSVLAGEPSTGGEWLIPQAGITSDRAASLLAGAARPWGLAVGRPAPAATGGSMGGPIRIQLSWSGGHGDTALGRAIMGNLRANIQGSYGGNVQLALGQY